MRFTTALLLSLCAALPLTATAQDREGNDTPGDWKVTHFERFGIYLSSCDERQESDQLNQRCYLRYVDVFSPHPEFAAQFFFVVNTEDGPEVDFGMEAGTLFSPNGFRIEGENGELWKTRRVGCLTGLTCTFSGEDADALLAAMRDGDAFRFTFRDRHGKSQDLIWSLDGFSDAFADFNAQTTARGL
ncbi:hypothetical protein [Cognatishimia activa]|uniref:Invasion protein B, involved in pathogenesis n=1 Tax=Cognatishimia activa TaxID=1715691 RepID=A0A0P1IN03_9RHOB|nr:hypothetical protein [Cognatishimia activa]CUJ16312.1 hypothetical protein TA5113_02497 [Cognatishimia activa]CUK25057.1 hypothetical protein TA5114_00847 [Cognatishimia activa]